MLSTHQAILSWKFLKQHIMRICVIVYSVTQMRVHFCMGADILNHTQKL